MQEEFYHQLWQAAGITDDFIFGNVMQMGGNCLNLLRAILPGLNLQKVRFVNTQKDIRTDHHRKGVRLDVFAEDDKRRVYDIEMQVKKQPTIGKRVRYYQSKIDADALRSGENIDKIKTSYIIFLMPKDQFGLDRRQYNFHYRCDEEPNLKLNTASHLIFLNSTGTKGMVSKDLQSFFDVMNNKYSANQFAQTISKDIEKVKADQDKERDFMDLAMKMHDAKQAGKIEGIKNGIKQGRHQEATVSATNIAQALKQEGQSNNYIIHLLSKSFDDTLTSKEINQIIKTIN